MTARVWATINRFWADRSLRTKALALLLLPLPILLAASAGMYRAQYGERQARVWVQHTFEVRGEIQETLVRLLDAETSARDFVLTGDPNALRPYWESRELLGQLIGNLVAQVADNPPQLLRARETHDLIQNEMDDLAALCENRPKSTKATTRDIDSIVMLDGGRDIAARVRAKLTAMQMEEDRLLQARSQVAEDSRFRLFTLLVEAIVLALFFQLAGALLLTGKLSAQIRGLETNAERFGQGLPAEPFVAETREAQGLDNGLQQVAARLAENERELRESDERIRAMFKDAPVACHEIDDEGIIRQANMAECTLLGYPAEEVLGKHVWDLVSRESRDVVRRNVMDRLAGVRPCSPYECDFECRDQSLVTVEIHEKPIRDKQGAILGLRSALLDVTARKMVTMAVKKVEQYAQELRTKNEELLLALGAAREASAAKGRFLAAMSHEFRTPLNGIIGLTELMFDGVAGPVSDDHTEYLGDTLASSRHLLHLVNDVLDLAKVESGKMEFHFEPLELAPLLCEVRDVLRILAERKKISISIDSSKVDRVVADASRLKQVVYNYLSNAIKFSSEGGAIEVRARREGERDFRIEVEDTGPGIEPADIPRLFADFQQLDTSKSGLGTGLGLALTKRIVEYQGGSVGVRSQLGTGSIFFAVLPIEPLAHHATEIPAEGGEFGGIAEARTQIPVFPAPMRARPRSIQAALRL
jgi:PAS domain S-box-containing protein